MKKAITAAVLAALLSVSAVSASALDGVYLNDHNTYALRVVDGEPMVAVRTFFEGAGYTVQWDASEPGARAFDADRMIGVYDGLSVIYLNGYGRRISSDIKMDNGTLVMPIDAAAKALDARIIYRNGAAYLTSSEVNDPSSWPYELLLLTNMARANAGLPSLVWNATLAEAAKAHCADMAERGYFAHETPEGITPLDRLRLRSVLCNTAAENIAAGQPDPATVFTGLMESPHHRENILDPELKELGIAFARGGLYGIYWAQEFIG